MARLASNSELGTRPVSRRRYFALAHTQPWLASRRKIARASRLLAPIRKCPPWEWMSKGARGMGAVAIEIQPVRPPHISVTTFAILSIPRRPKGQGSQRTRASECPLGSRGCAGRSDTGHRPVPSGSSRKCVPRFASENRAWQGRRTEGVALAHRGPRTQRGKICSREGGADFRDGPLARGTWHARLPGRPAAPPGHGREACRRQRARHPRPTTRTRPARSRLHGRLRQHRSHQSVVLLGPPSTQ